MTSLNNLSISSVVSSVGWRVSLIIRAPGRVTQVLPESFDSRWKLLTLGFSLGITLKLSIGVRRFFCSFCKQQFLYFFPLLHGHGSLRWIFLFVINLSPYSACANECLNLQVPYKRAFETTETLLSYASLLKICDDRVCWLSEWLRDRQTDTIQGGVRGWVRRRERSRKR